MTRTGGQRGGGRKRFLTWQGKQYQPVELAEIAGITPKTMVSRTSEAWPQQRDGVRSLAARSAFEALSENRVPALGAATRRDQMRKTPIFKV
jgi:hypothetical protein